MEIAHTFEELSSKLRLSLGGLIAVDGFCSSGKTCLAENLGRDLPATVIHVDEYCTPHDDPPTYVECVDFSRLAQDLQQLDPRQLSVVEGICLREVISKCGVIARTYVYVKRVGSNGLWHDGFDLEKYEAEDGNLGAMEPHASDFAYHSKIRPHEQADIVFFHTAHAAI